MVEAAVRRLAKVTHFIVKAEAKTLVVYLSDAHEDAALNILRGFAPMTGEESRSMTDYMLKHAKYVKMMRFSLVDEKDRLFSADRWCFRGSVDNWHRLKWRDSLEALLEEFVPHLGRESFYDLI